MNRTAILIDGGFFVKRAIRLWGKKTPEELANILQDYCNRHLKRNREDYHQLYRIFYYDCPPINKKMHHPLTNRLIDYSKTEQYEWRLAFHDQLRKLRKMALRLGNLDEEGTNWNLDPALLRSVITGKLPISKLREEDIILNTKQKGVDMRIGVDIASMAYKKQVEQMILIAGDSDFVPAAKLARREGIDFILDPLWAQIKPDLFEHIDGLRTVCENPVAGRDSFEDAGKAEYGYDEDEDDGIGHSPVPAPVAATPAPAAVPAAAAVPASAVPASAVPTAGDAKPASSPRRRSRRKPAAKPAGEPVKPAGEPAKSAASAAAVQPAKPAAPAAASQPAKPAASAAATQPEPSGGTSAEHPVPTHDAGTSGVATADAKPARSRSAGRRHRRPKSAAAAADPSTGASPAGGSDPV